MAGFRVHVELIGLAVRFEFLLQPRHLRRRGILVLLAKDAEQRAGQVPSIVVNIRNSEFIALLCAKIAFLIRGSIYGSAMLYNGP